MAQTYFYIINEKADGFKSMYMNNPNCQAGGARMPGWTVQQVTNMPDGSGRVIATHPKIGSRVFKIFKGTTGTYQGA